MWKINVENAYENSFQPVSEIVHSFHCTYYCEIHSYLINICGRLWHIFFFQAGRKMYQVLINFLFRL